VCYLAAIAVFCNVKSKSALALSRDLDLSATRPHHALHNAGDGRVRF
jgi:hypothetical protein